jgi:peptidoglycan/xylan/chitin deacetylase (PgdA/CDA1 family)
MGPSRWRQVMRVVLAAILPRRVLWVHGPARTKAIWLTFDDGPHPEYTPQVLNVLRDQRVTATFFVIGQLAERHPDLVRRMAAEGHAVGNHSYHHGAPSRTSARQLIQEVRRTNDLVASLVGEAPDLFRPPFGKVTIWKLLRLWWAGQTIVLWNVDPKDYACQCVEEVRRWFQNRPLRGGDVVLMHDNLPHAGMVLPELIESARGRGMVFTKMIPGKL